MDCMFYSVTQNELGNNKDWSKYRDKHDKNTFYMIYLFGTKLD